MQTHQDDRMNTESQRERAQQERLLEALDAAPSQLRRDECGWRIIKGQFGTIHTWGDDKTWVAYVTCRSIRQWTITKRRLGFMKVTQDGDDEGCLRLLDLPTPEQAVIIRDVLGLRKRVAYSPETLERKRASMAKAISAWRPAEAATTAPEDASAPSGAQTPSFEAAGRTGEESEELVNAEVEQ
jgi:hypothetical protein